MERILRVPEMDAGSLPFVSWSASGSRVPVLAIMQNVGGFSTTEATNENLCSVVVVDRISHVAKE